MKKHAAGWDTDAPSLAQFSELFLHADRGKVTKESLQNFMEGEKKEKSEPGFAWARHILGRDFIGPEELAKVSNMDYSKAQIRKLVKILPSQKCLHDFHRNGYVLIVGPGYSMSVSDINQEFKADHYKVDERTNEDMVEFGWLCLRKDPYPESIGKTWQEQLSLLLPGEQVANIAEVVWGYFVYKAIRREDFFSNTVRTSSTIGIEGKHSCLAYVFNAPIVACCCDDNPDGEFASIAVCRKDFRALVSP